LNCFNLVQYAQLLRRQALAPFLSISSIYGWFKENTCCLVYLPVMVLTHQGGEGAWALPYFALPFEFASLLREWIGVGSSAMISRIYKATAGSSIQFSLDLLTPSQLGIPTILDSFKGLL
jgi:hypothetical protein